MNDRLSHSGDDAGDDVANVVFAADRFTDKVFAAASRSSFKRRQLVYQYLRVQQLNFAAAQTRQKLQEQTRLVELAFEIYNAVRLE